MLASEFSQSLTLGPWERLDYTRTSQKLKSVSVSVIKTNTSEEFQSVSVILGHWNESLFWGREREEGRAGLHRDTLPSTRKFIPDKFKSASVSRGASGDSLHGGASFEADKAHFAALKRVWSTAKMK